MQHEDRRAPIGHRVDEDEGGAALEQIERQVHAPDAVVDHLDIRTEAAGHAAHHLGTEAVVSEEDVADSGDQDP